MCAERLSATANDAAPGEIQPARLPAPSDEAPREVKPTRLPAPAANIMLPSAHMLPPPHANSPAGSHHSATPLPAYSSFAPSIQGLSTHTSPQTSPYSSPRPPPTADKA